MASRFRDRRSALALRLCLPRECGFLRGCKAAPLLWWCPPPTSQPRSVLRPKPRPLLRSPSLPLLRPRSLPQLCSRSMLFLRPRFASLMRSRSLPSLRRCARVGGLLRRGEGARQRGCSSRLLSLVRSLCRCASRVRCRLPPRSSSPPPLRSAGCYRLVPPRPPRSISTARARERPSEAGARTWPKAQL